MKNTNAGKQRKFLAARIVCGLLLGAYLTWGYCMPVALGATGWKIQGPDADATETNASAWGSGTASGSGSTAFGRSTTASGIASTAWGYKANATALYSTAFGVNTKAKGGSSTAFGEITTASGYASAAFGYNTTAGGWYATAFGYKSEANGIGSTAWGGYWNSNEDNEKGGTASGDSSTAFGIESNAAAKNSLAALGGIVDTDGENSAAIGKGAKVTVADTVALGSDSVASREKGDKNAYMKGSNTGSAWESTHNAIAVGDDDTATRQITGVAAGSKDTDAVNVAQLKAAGAMTSKTLSLMSSSINDLQALTAGFPEGKTIKQTMDEGLDTKANKDMDNLTEAGKTVVKDLAKGAVNVVGDGPVSVAKSDVGGVDTYTVSVKADGKVEDGDTGLVTGGTVYTALAGKADAADIAALDSRVTTNESNIATNTSNISALDTRVTQNETDLSALESRVTTNEGNIATNTTNITKLNDALYGDTLSLGKGSEATGTNSIAIGFGNKVSGNNSGAFGDPSDVSGNNSYAFGNNNTVSGDNTFVLGNNVNTAASNAVVLGDGSEGVDGAVSVGSSDNKRQIKNVADGTEDSDAATYGQLKAIAGGAGEGLTEISHRISNLDSKVNKAGAGAAALAALHPIDTDSKFTMGAGFGSYHGANAMALGLFYRPTDNVMLSIGGAMGNGENMINAGVSFALDKGVNTSKAAMARKINALSEENAAIREENAAIKEQNAKLEARLAAIEAKLGK